MVPEHPDQTVLNGQHAEFEVFFREIDPLQAAWVRASRPSPCRRSTVGCWPACWRTAASWTGPSRPGQGVQSDALTGDLQRGDAVAGVSA